MKIGDSDSGKNAKRVDSGNSRLRFLLELYPCVPVSSSTPREAAAIASRSGH